MKKFIIYIILTVLITNSVSNAQNKADLPWSVNEATLIGIGKYNIKDTFHSDLKYTGFGVRILNERMKMTRLMDYNVSRQQIINVDFSVTKNPARNVKDWSGFIDYSLAYHYHFRPLQNLKVLAGSGIHALGGFIYNTRNGNNPASAKADIDLTLSAMAIYNFKIKNLPLTFRYQAELPFMGILFSPHYGQPYYFIFMQGDNKGIVNFSSFHNKFAMKNFITLDIPVAKCTIRLGYLNSMYRLNVQQIKSHIISNSFTIGFVKEFVAFRGKKMGQTKHFKSAFY